MRRFPLCGLMLLPFLAAAATYEADWTSLERHEAPAWFAEAKLGIFIHWGVYSVPAYGPRGTYSEWYWYYLERAPRKHTRAFHERVYGASFEYADFAPLFTAEMFDPAQWADLFKRSGAKYVVLTSKHHDGYCLWPSADSWNWNSMDTGPHRDLCGELSEAVKAVGLKMGFYYSLYEWFNPTYQSDVDRYVDEHMLPQIRDLVERYEPDLLWGDGEWSHPPETWRSAEFLAWLFNRQGDAVVVNDRWGKGTRGRLGDFLTTEYGHGSRGEGKPWEECRGIGASFGYNRNERIEDYRTPEELVRILVDTASAGGNLLLDVGPTADGRIPVIMQERLLQLGSWLKANGEAIYGTTAGPVLFVPWGRATAKPGRVYLHVSDWPESGTLELPGLMNNITRASLLVDESVAVQVSGAPGEYVLHVPSAPPTPYAGVVVLDIEGEPVVENAIRVGAGGDLTLPARRAEIVGKTARLENGGTNVGYWSDANDFVRWTVRVPRAGRYDVHLLYAAAPSAEGGVCAVEAGGQRVSRKVDVTGAWDRYEEKPVGVLDLPAGDVEVCVRAEKVFGDGLLNLRALRLSPAAD